MNLLKLSNISELISFLSKHLDLDNRTEDIIGPRDTDDSAVVEFNHDKLVLTTDSHTVDPDFFRGGNIGDLSIAGQLMI